MNYSIQAGNFPILTIILENKGERCFAEMSTKRKSYIGSSPVYSEEDARRGIKTGDLKKTFATGAELDGTAASVQGPPWVKFAHQHRVNVEHKKDLDAGGENNFVIYEALALNQKVSFTTCFPGEIIVWSQDVYGKLRITKGAFLAAQNIKIGSYTLSKQNASQDQMKKNLGVINQSETKGKFMELSGNGVAFLEVPGMVLKEVLAPGESYDVTPGHLLAFTEDISLEMKESGDMGLRIAENNPFGIRCTAGSRGGVVYICSGNPPVFWRHKPKDIK